LNVKSLSSSSESGNEKEQRVQPLNEGRDRGIVEVSKDFITKAKVAVPSRTPSSGRSEIDSMGPLIDGPSRLRQGSEQMRHGDETDLKVIVGSPDDEIRSTQVDDLERQYLGKYSAGGLPNDTH
jgi:hypothetical protein